jgi:hypothetical protein
VLYTDYKFLSRTKRHAWSSQHQGFHRQRQNNYSQDNHQYNKEICYIYNKPKYHSYNHPDKERCKARDRYNDYQHIEGKPAASSHNYQTFMMNFEEGLTIKLDSEGDNTANENDEKGATTYFIVNKLQDCAFIHRIKRSHNGTKQKGFNHS